MIRLVNATCLFVEENEGSIYIDESPAGFSCCSKYVWWLCFVFEKTRPLTFFVINSWRPFWQCTQSRW